MFQSIAVSVDDEGIHEHRAKEQQLDTVIQPAVEVASDFFDSQEKEIVIPLFKYSFYYNTNFQHLCIKKLFCWR